MIPIDLVFLSQELFEMSKNDILSTCRMNRLEYDFDYWCSFQVVSLSKKFVELHANYSSHIIELMEKNARTGAPVNPPIWWIAPDDPVALMCDSGIAVP